MNDSKPLKAVSGAKAARPLPRPLQKASDRALSLLGDYLSDMFDSADDKLFDLLGGEQSGAMEAMRELRLKRAGIEAGFRQLLESQFRHSARPEATESVLGSVDLNNLSLVQDDQMELDLAVNNTARRVRMAADEQLRAFNHRLEYLCEGKVEFGERNSPLDPLQVIHAFRGEAEKLEVDINTRLIMFKLFERVVLAELGYIVTEVNQVLIDSGVLADMKVAPIRPSRPPGQPTRGRDTASAADAALPAALAGAIPAGAVAAPDPAALYAVFGELLDAVRVLAGHSRATPGPANMAVMQNGVAYVNGAPLTDGAEVRAVTSDALVGMLDRLQRVESSLEELEHGETGVTHSEDMDVRVELSGLLGAEADEATVHALDQADDAVINLVSMLFDYIFDDQALAPEIKALIGRLQIPFIKTAIADKRFFSDEEHEARRYLNALAQAGTQWSSSQGVSDPLYCMIRESIFRVLNDYELDVSLFASLRADIEEIIDNREHRQQRIDDRLQEAEQGKVLAEQARQQVAQVLRQRVGERALPKVVTTLVRDGWQQVLYMTCLREGSDSEQWQHYLKILDVLIWSAFPKKDAPAKAKLATLAPKLRASLRKGLAAIGYDSAVSRELLAQLQQLHEDLLSDAATPPAAVEREALDLPAATAPVAEADELPLDHPLLKQVVALKAGQWIRIGAGQDSRRLRLAANVRHGTKLVFINARGIRELEYSGQQLARAIEAAEVALVDGTPLFDRALESVIGELRQLHQSAPAVG